MPKPRLLPLLAALLVLLSLLALGLRVGGQLYRNHQLVTGFTSIDRPQQYSRGVPMEQMDLSVYSSYLSVPQTAQSNLVDNTLILPITVQYYAVENGEKHLVLEIPKGTSVLWIPAEEMNAFYLGYGLRGYPTYEKGWRYAQPFLTAGQQEDWQKLPYYYVQTAALEAVARKALRSSQYLQYLLQQRNRTLEEGVFTYTRFIDEQFYEDHIFCSPDLQRQVWRWPDTVLLGIAACMALAAGYVLRSLGRDARNRKLRNKQPQSGTYRNTSISPE